MWFRLFYLTTSRSSITSYFVYFTLRTKTLKFMRALLLSTCFLLLFSCAEQQNEHKQEVVQGEWIKGTEQEKLDIIEEQFAGFSTTMVEVAYRYQELYWAGQDENWEYADYQLEHIEEAMEEGFVRRPSRERASEHFMTYTIIEMETAIESGDKELFNEKFEQMRRDCKSCHNMEKVPFIDVTIPKLRTVPSGF